MELLRTPLYDLHQAHGARTAEFAGYEMPIRFAPGIIAEHLHTRSSAGLFDVSHMGVIELRGPSVAEQLERLVPAALLALPPGKLRYSFFTNEAGGILDDLMITNAGDHFSLVVNAGRKEADLDHLRSGLDPSIEITPRPDLALLAIQGPAAVGVVSAMTDVEIATMAFMTSTAALLQGIEATVSRSGYTGEDGFEIAVRVEDAVELAGLLLSDERVAPAGLGARDSLRLEAGLCLYGHDLDESITPVEADLVWAMQRRRREEGGFPGFETIAAQLEAGPPRRRVGLRPDGRAPVREGAGLVVAGRPVGTVTSGGFGPSLDAPVAMGYVTPDLAVPGTPLHAIQRGKEVPVTVTGLPFVPHSYYRGQS
ncbi:MAG: glycine cleavage system aminomethyltransferase GcvT [Acidimicrobiia bacterium]|nr:glycine cleavage system aminomethyltransferase GcvT [Acidimicrobiia bacterium]